jgi:hypothetical protein
MSCTSSKVPFWQFFIFAKMALLNPCKKFEIFFGQKHSESIMKMAIRQNFHNTSQGPPNPGFTEEKVQKEDFLKKPSRELKNYFCFRFL